MLKSMTQTPVENHTEGLKTREKFSIIPQDLFRKAFLSPYAVVVFLELDARIGQKGSQRVLRNTLAEGLGLSLKTVARALKELEEKGLLVRHRTGRSNRYQLINLSRVKSVLSDRSEVSHPQINNSLINNQNKNEPLQALAVVAVEGELTNKTYTETALKVITAETGVKVALNEKTLKACSRALKLGFDSPHSYGLEVAKHYKNEATKKTIKSPSGFLVSVSMVAILEGETIQENKPTPIPPRYNSNQLETLCSTHGDEGFLINACPPCRQLNREQVNLLSVVSL